MAIKIVIDSASDLDKVEAEQKGATLVSMEVRFDDEVYLDGVNLSNRRFFEKLIESDQLPKTSQINEYTFEETYEKLVNEGDEVIVITLSSKLSGTYNSAERAAKKFAGKVFVVDSLNACIGQRILFEYALRLVEEGKLSASEIAEKLNSKKKKVQLLGVLGTLKYLKKGGRISSVVAFTGEAFSIKPVVSVINGEVKLVGKAIGSKKGNNLLNQLVEKCGGIDFDMPYCVGYSGLSDDVLKKYLEDSQALWKHQTDSIPSFMIGSTIGTHIGPGAIAVAFFSKD